MLTDTYAPRRHRRAVAAAIVLATVHAVVGSCLAYGGTSRDSARQPSPSSTGPDVPPPAAPTTVDSNGGVPVASADPTTFATSVASTLFDWDTAGAGSPVEYADRLLAVGDPSGQESAGLAADVAAYLPTTEGWAFLKQYYTRQWLEVRSVNEPDQWEQAMAEAGPAGLDTGTIALTVEGVRHREGEWNGAAVTSEHDVAFTVFVVCGPSYATCHLLRLSRLDDPLD
jgi:hypothetical protein